MGISWRGQIDQRRVELLSDGLTYAQTAHILSNEFNVPVTKRAVEGRCRTTGMNKHSLGYYSAEVVSSPFNATISQTRLFPDECYVVDHEMRMTPQKIQELKEIYQRLTELKPRKILSLSDTHAPFIDFASVEQAVMANLDADICLLNGDIFDGQPIS